VDRPDAPSGQRAALPSFFEAYDGPVPSWSERQAAMVARCEELERFCQRWNGAGVDLWRQRSAPTAAWSE
jgi:hypothetical protein